MLLSKFTSNITDGVHNTVLDDKNGSFYLLSCKNIKNGNVIISNNERKINHETFMALRKRSKLEKNDVLITTVGTIGETAIIKEDNPNYDFQRSVGIIKCNNLLMPKYLLYFLQSNTGQNQIKSLIKGAVQSCLFLSDIGNIEINYVNLSYQQHIVDIVRKDVIISENI